MQGAQFVTSRRTRKPGAALAFEEIEGAAPKMEPNHAIDERAYASAMKEIEELSGATRGTPEAHRLQVLVAYVVAYQAQHPPEERASGA